MNEVRLLDETGQPSIDDVLRGIVAAFETRFPGRVRGYYLTGSYADGSARSFSDVDLSILFRDGFQSVDEESAAEGIVQRLARTSPVGLDVAPLPEEIPYPLRHASVKLGSRLIYGQDTREQMALPPMEAYVRHAMDLAYRTLARLRPGGGALVIPIDYPDPATPFFGYAREGSTSESGPAGDTKDLVVGVGLATTAIVAARAGCYVPGKREAVQLYRQHVGDAWTELVSAIPSRCRDAWGYQIPQETEAQLELRRLCGQVRDFENHFLTLYQEHRFGIADC